MRAWQSQSHVQWYGKYHIVFVPKYRQRVLYGPLRRSIERILRELCQQQGVELVEGHATPDHVHLCLSMPPKYSVVHTVGWLMGKSAIRMHREFFGRERNFTGLHFWARGYCVSTVGLDEQVIRAYIRHEEQEEKRQEQMPLKGLETFSWTLEGLQTLSSDYIESLGPFLHVTGPLWGPSSNHPLCGWYMIRRGVIAEPGKAAVPDAAATADDRGSRIPED